MQRHAVDEPVSEQQKAEAQILGQLDLGKQEFVQIKDDEYATDEDDDGEMSEADKIKLKEDIGNLAAKADKKKKKAEEKRLKQIEFAKESEEKAKQAELDVIKKAL